jgi:hypothetical protein
LSPRGLGIFGLANHYLTPVTTDLSNAKFIGYAFGRFTMPRLRVSYELDKLFANDSYCEFSQSPDHLEHKFQNFKDNYASEINWFKTKNFNTRINAERYQQLVTSHVWETSYSEYHNIWNNFKIEVVAETDEMSGYFFTEKTARCLSSGKPFVLIAGTNSLARLREMGFQTYGSVLDETYDAAEHPYKRIKMIVESLWELYNSPDQSSRITQMYQIAEENMVTYKSKFR